MKCDVCEKEATVHLTQIINGQMNTVNLCEHCSKQKGVTDEMGFGLAEAFLGPAAVAGAKPSPSDDLACPACGFTQGQLKKIGRMGCPECYGTFREGLDNLLRTMHKGTKHIGKTPRRAAAAQAAATTTAKATAKPSPPPVAEKPAAAPPPEKQPARTAAAIREAMEAAVRDERYEDAAKLKAELEKLQRKSAKSAN